MARAVERQLAAEHVHFVAVVERDESAVDAVVDEIKARAHQPDGQMIAGRVAVGHDEIAFFAATDRDFRTPLIDSYGFLIERNEQTSGITGNDLVCMEIHLRDVHTLWLPQDLIDR